MIAVHESALDAIKEMGRRDKDRIEELEAALRNLQGIMRHHITTYTGAIYVIEELMINPYSTAIIQKAE